MLQEEGRVSLGSQPEPPESNDLSNLAPPDMTDTIDGKSFLLSRGLTVSVVSKSTH